MVTSANNVSIQNCNINGSGVGLNASANTSTTASVNTTYGIFVGTGASTVAQTTAPAAISSISTVIASGATANNFTVNNNVINSCKGRFSEWWIYRILQQPDSNQ